MNLAHGRQLAIDLASALNIKNRNVRSITVKADCRETASVTIEFIPTAEECGMLGTILKTYQLVSVEPIETRHV